MQIEMNIDVYTADLSIEGVKAEFEIDNVNETPAEFLGFSVEGLRFTREMLVQLLCESMVREYEADADQYAWDHRAELEAA